MFDSLGEYPHWFVVACAALACAVLLWLLVRVLKIALWLMYIGIVLICLAALAAYFFR